MDAEGARALARRIAAQEQAAESQAAESAVTPPADGQTLQERLVSGRVAPAGVGQRRAQATLLPGFELRFYARNVEEQVVDGRSAYVEIWWCRARQRGVWQAPYVVREVVRGTVPAPEDSSSARLKSPRSDTDRGLFRQFWSLVALEP
jgi:hypothetical protein